jgi:hypothetical protein
MAAAAPPQCCPICPVKPPADRQIRPRREALRNRAALISAGAAALFLLAVATPAHAGYGAIAYDQTTGTFGASQNEPTASRANEVALKNCGSPECRVHAVEPRGCGALAKSDSDKAWGGADRENIEAAKRDAIQRCQSHTSTGHCNVVVSACNK